MPSKTGVLKERRTPSPYHIADAGKMVQKGDEMSEARKLIQCTKCVTLVHQDEVPTIQFYAEHKPLPYCQRCFNAIPDVYKRQIGESMTQGK